MNDNYKDSVIQKLQTENEELKKKVEELQKKLDEKHKQELMEIAWKL